MVKVQYAMTIIRFAGHPNWRAYAGPPFIVAYALDKAFSTRIP